MAFAWLEKWTRSKKSKKSKVAAEESDVLAPLANVDKAPRRERNHRVSVSAEVFGRINRIEDVVIPNRPKTDEEYERLRGVLSRTDLFAALLDEEIERLIPAFVEVKLTEGTMFIKEQERGDCLYVVESGSVKVTKMIDGKETHLCIMGPTESVGELALLHCCPRAATCTALADLTVWKLDREPFSVIVRQAAIERRSNYLDFLNGVSVISDLHPYSRSRVCDALKTQIFRASELVITKGAIGDRFFILVEGNCVALHGGQVVKEYSPGQYFGELALLHDERRKCDIRVTSKQLKVLRCLRIALLGCYMFPEINSYSTRQPILCCRILAHDDSCLGKGRGFFPRWGRFYLRFIFAHYPK